MPVCEIHTCYYTDYCRYCFQEGKRKEKKEIKDSLPVLIDKMQASFNAKQKKLYTRGNTILCSTCPTKIKANATGIWAMHYGHFFDKSIYWYFMFHPMNGLPQCYNCNVNLNGNKVELQKALLKIHGIEKWEAFLAEVDVWYNEMKQGLWPKSPDIDFVNSIKI